MMDVPRNYSWREKKMYCKDSMQFSQTIAGNLGSYLEHPSEPVTMALLIVEFFQTLLLYVLGIFVVGLGYVLSKFWPNEKVRKLFRTFPGPPRVPLFGNAFQFNVPSEQLYHLQFYLRKIYGQRVLINIGPINYVTLADPVDVEKLLTSSTNIEKAHVYLTITPWMGEGLLTSRGAKWQHRRKLLTPTFHFKILDDFLHVFNEHAHVLVDIFQTEFSKGQVGNICPYLARCTLDIICETAMGRRINAQIDRNSLYVMAVTKACEMIARRFVRPWYWPHLIFNLTPSGREFNKSLKVLHNFTTQVIQEKKQTINASNDNATNAPEQTDESDYWYGKRRLAFLDLLLEAQQNPENDLSDLDIREEVDTFMFEGHDTTAASLSWTIFMLGSYPEHQMKVHEELDQIFGQDRSRPVTPKDLREMKYLEMCIKEALRLYPSVPFIARKLSTDLILDKNTTIPAGVNVSLLTMIIHYNEKIYSEPKKFIPDRFLVENIKSRHPFAYIPFSAGPRNCIGQKFALMEEKVVLAHLFRNFKVEAVDRREDVTVMVEVITKPRDGLKMRLVPR